MAGEVPDPLELKSWEDAFSHPIPVVRKLEQQLRRHADENREKLRTWVGVSYRDLLGTAERIIDMDQQMHMVEVILGQTGQKCNARAVSKTTRNFGSLRSDGNVRCHDRYSLASQMAILECCPTVIRRILRQKGPLLQAAKLLLLARLTHKTLAQRAEAPPLVDKLRERLASLRSRLLRAVDQRFAHFERDVAKLVDDMCAFALATSSTPTDVLHHFLKVRLRAIQWHLEQTHDIHTHAIKAMKLLLNTLRNGQTIFPKRLADALVRLKDLPLIKQPDVQSITELQLSTHIHWLADELKNYTPWPRHDELQKSEADKMLRSWAKTAQKAMVMGLKEALDSIKQFDRIITIRQQIFEAWPWASSRLPGLHPADVVDDLRHTFNDRLTTVIEAQVASLRLVCKSAQELLAQKNNKQGASMTLWSSSLSEMDVGVGGQKYKEAVLISYNGYDTTKLPPVQSFENTLQGIRKIQADLKQMREAHWDDDLGDDDDEMDSRHTLLSEDDPRTLHDCLAEALKTEADRLHSDFTTLVQQAGPNSATTALAVTLLRVLREISRRSVGQEKLLADVAVPLTTSQIVIAPLHSALATAASARARVVLESSSSRLLKSHVAAGRTLWEGKPPLPAQPSATTIKFLKTLTEEMSSLGADLWSEAAVTNLKRTSLEMIAKLVEDTVDKLSAIEKTLPTTNGTTRKSEDEKEDGEGQNQDAETSDPADHSSLDHASKTQIAKDKLIQLVMDFNYLSAALSSVSIGQAEQLQQVLEKAATHAELGEGERARLQKSAADYWKRTYLLFALLTPGR